MGGVLRIDRFQADCHVWGPSDVAPGVVDRASRALRHHVPHTLKRAFSSWLDRDDDSVWVVRRLDLMVAAAAEAPPDLLAALVSRSLGQALADTLRGDGDGVSAIRFPNRTAYLARFVVDAAAGSAWNLWYYRPFAGLKALSVSAAVRTALSENPARGLAALAALGDDELAHVLGVLAPEDEARLIETFASEAEKASAPIEAVFATAWTAFARACDLGVVGGRATFAFVRADRAFGARALARALQVIAQAFRAMESAHASQVARPGPAGTGGSDAHGLAIAYGKLPPFLAREMANHVVAREHRGESASSETIETCFGGVFLLLRDLDTLPWTSWTARWPRPPRSDSPALLKWLTAAACTGRSHAAAVLEDGALRAILGVSSDLTAFEVARWLRRIGADRGRVLDRAVVAETDASPLTRADRSWLSLPGVGAAWRRVLARAARLVLRRFARRLPGFGESTPPHLWRNFLVFDAVIENEDARVVVRCGRPPLHLVLTLTGMTRGLLAGRDPDDRPILLFPRE